jgi:hypothetical protein
MTMAATVIKKKKARTGEAPLGITDRVSYTKEKVRKVLGAVMMVAQQIRDPDLQSVYDEDAVFGFCELLEDRLQDIHKRLESIVHTLDEAGQGPTDRSVPTKRRGKA